MKSNDVPIGAGLLVLALLILWHVSSFPPAPGQPYNAALFPGIAGSRPGAGGDRADRHRARKKQRDRSALASGRRRRSRAPRATSQDAGSARDRQVPSRLLAILFTAGAIVFYLIAANFLGFIITGIDHPGGADVGLRRHVPRARCRSRSSARWLIHLAFYKLLSVPLPWGLLQPFAW